MIIICCPVRPRNYWMQTSILYLESSELMGAYGAYLTLFIV